MHHVAARSHREHKDRGTKRRDLRGKAIAPKDTKESAPAQLIIDCKYVNELPKPPVPKLLRALPSADRLYRYTPTALELDHRPFLLTEKDMMSRIELVDPDAYGKLLSPNSMPPPLPPHDAQLLRDDDIGEDEREAERKRRRLTEPTEAWQREGFPFQWPQLLTNDLFTERQRFTTGTFAAEKKISRNPPPRPTIEDLAQKVEQTFEVAKTPPVHPTNPKLKPKRILPVVPDAVLWANKYRQVVFDELPEKPSMQDLLFKTVPTPRATCFGYFSHAEGAEPNSYKLAQNYIWDNRGGFTRQLNCSEGETLLLSFPSNDTAVGGEARFVTVPPRMLLKKQKAHRLDISLETQALFIRYRDPSAQEAQEEHERMSAVLSEEVRDDGDNSDMLVEYIDGEWQLHGRVPTSRETSLGSSHGGSLRGTPPGSAGRRTPIANSPHDASTGGRRMQIEDSPSRRPTTTASHQAKHGSNVPELPTH